MKIVMIDIVCNVCIFVWIFCNLSFVKIWVWWVVFFFLVGFVEVIVIGLYWFIKWYVIVLFGICIVMLFGWFKYFLDLFNLRDFI